MLAKTRAETRIGRIESRLARIDPTKDDAALYRYREQLDSIETELDEINERIHEAAPRWAEVAAPPALTLAQQRRSLDPGTVVLAYSVGRDRSMVLVTGADDGPDPRAFTISVTEEDLRARVERFNSLIARGRTVSEIERAVNAQATRLFELLVAPAWNTIEAAERVLIVPDGPLHDLTFAALVIPGEDTRFFGLAKPLFFNPSASLAVELGASASRRMARPRTIVAFGDPVYPPTAAVVREHRLDRLPGSRAEIEAIRRLFGDRSAVFLGEAASESNFKAHGGDANVLHCAVHARVDPRVSMDSSLYFSLPGDPELSPEDGVLSAWEIAETLDTDAEIVVLSTCSSARGRLVPGEGIIGLARAFQIAGARTVVSSQWAVPDHSTAELMTAFYEQLVDGRSTVEALHHAQRMVGSDPELAHPYHWASFQVWGDWR